MIRVIISVMLCSSFIFSDWLYISNNTRCVYDLAPNPDGNGWCYRYSDSGDDTMICATKSDITDFVDGYRYDASTDVCALEPDLRLTGMTKDQYVNTMVYIASFFSALLVFSLLLLI